MCITAHIILCLKYRDCTGKINQDNIVTQCTKQLMEGCLLKRLWIKAIMINDPEGGMKSASLLSFLAKAAAKYAGSSGDLRQESRSCSKNITISRVSVQQEWIKELYCSHFNPEHATARY